MNPHSTRACQRILLLATVAALALPWQSAHPAPFKDFIKKKADQVQNVLERLDPSSEPAAEDPDEEPSASPGPTPNYPRAEVHRIQRLLNQLGYEPGPADGAFGPGTADAIRRYQADHGLLQTGEPSAELQAHMMRTVQSGTSAGNTAVAGSPAAAPAPAGGTGTSGSMVAPAPAGAEAVSAPAPAATATPAGSAAAPASATPAGMLARWRAAKPGAAAPASASTGAAEQAGLRIVRGLPLLINARSADDAKREGIADADDYAAMLRFLDHARIGLNPSIALSPMGGAGGTSSAFPKARCVASRLLPADAKNEVLASAGTHSSDLRYWKGEAQRGGGAPEDEFELHRAKARFNEFLPGLVAAAPALPMKFVLIERLRLSPYDHDLKAFPFANGRPIEIALPESGCRLFENDYLPIATELPSSWPLDPQGAEALIQRLPAETGYHQSNIRKVFVAVELTLSGAPESPVKDQRGGTGVPMVVPMKIEVQSVALYEDPDLERHLYTFGLHRPGPSVLLSGLPEQVPVPDPVRLNSDTVTLLLLKTQGDVLSTEAWNQFARHQSDADQLYYKKERHRTVGGGTNIEVLDTYDPAYVPFFPLGVTLAHHQSLNDEQLASFRAWSMMRAVALPERLQLTADLARIDGGNGADYPQFKFSQTELSPRVDLQAIIARGVSEQQLEFPELDNHEHYLAGPERRREAVLLFPNTVDSYLPDVTLDELTAAADGSRWSWTVEMDVEVPAVEVVPGGATSGPYGRPASDAVLLQVEPIAMRVLHRVYRPELINSADRPIVTLHEQKYEVKGLEPTRKDDWDVVGIRLGMPLQEAEAIVRQQMEVARVYDRRKRDEALGHGYAASRVFFGTREYEIVALYTTASDPRSVQAVFRRTPVDSGKVASADRGTERDPVYKALTAKYGQDVRKSNYHLYWGVAGDRSPCSAFRGSSLGTSDSTLLGGKPPTSGDHLAQLDFGLYDKIQVTGSRQGRPAGAWSNCSPVVVARPSGIQLDLWLFDHSQAVPSAEREYRAYVERTAELSRSAAADLEL